jgi:hypothetical protein
MQIFFYVRVIVRLKKAHTQVGHDVFFMVGACGQVFVIEVIFRFAGGFVYFFPGKKHRSAGNCQTRSLASRTFEQVSSLFGFKRHGRSGVDSNIPAGVFC